MARKILGIITAYLIFAVTAVALFQVSGHDAHQPQSIGFMLVTAVYGICFSFLAGIVLQLIARTGNIKVNYLLAVIMAGFAAFSLIMSGGSHWTQLMAILLFAPASIAGGMFYLRRK